MRSARRRLAQIEIAIALAVGPTLGLLYAAQPSFMGGPMWLTDAGGAAMPLLAAGLYLIGLAWLLEIADTEV